MQVKIVSQKVAKVCVEVLVLGFFQNVRPIQGMAAEIDWLYHGIISHLLKQEKMSGALGEMILLATFEKLPTPKALFMGLGETSRYNPTILSNVLPALFDTLHALRVQTVALELWGMAGCDLEFSVGLDTLLKGKQPLPEGFQFSLLVKGEEQARSLVYQLRSGDVPLSSEIVVQ